MDNIDHHELPRTTEGVEPPKEIPTPFPSDVIVEKRRVGKTDLTTVLCRHTKDNSPAIAEALKDSTIVAFEQVGNTSAKKRQYEQLYTLLLSRHTDPQKVAQTFSDLENENWDIADILKLLQGSDKRVVFLDMAEDDPDYSVVIHAGQTRDDYIKSVINLLPIEKARETALLSAQATGTEYDTRDNVLSKQITALLEQSEQEEPTPSIGVMAGLMHHKAIAAVTNEGESENSQEKIEKEMSFYDQYVHALRKGDTEKAAAAADRALLSTYLVAHIVGPEKGDEADALVAKLDDAKLSNIFNYLSYDLADMATPLVTKEKSIKMYLGGIVESIEHSRDINVVLH